MFGFFDKNILDSISQGVVIENIVLEVNEPGRFLQFLDEGIEFALSISKNFYLNLKTEHQIDVAFQKGNITVNRVKHNILDIREKVLKMYYNEIVAPNLRKAFIDDDFNKCTKMYLVGGGALYPELVDCFKEEFGDIVSVNVYPEPEKCASQGYCLNSKIKSYVARSNIPHNIEAEEIKIFRNPQLAVGIDIGNANTCVTIYKEGE